MSSVPSTASGGATIVGSAVATTSTPSFSAIAGTYLRNVSSQPSGQIGYYGTDAWRYTLDPYIAYSNGTDVSVTFSFTGVAAAYLATKKADRGLCLLLLNNTIPYTPDLYDATGYSRDQEVIWYSGTLPYGLHNVTISQLGPDSRLGYYPYLVAETWFEVVPTDIAAYVATESPPTPTPSSTLSSKHRPDQAAIASGVIAAVIACVLAGVLVYLWRRGRRGRKAHKAVADPVAIEDSARNPGGGRHDGWRGGGGDFGSVPGLSGILDGHGFPHHPYPSGFDNQPPLSYHHAYAPPPPLMSTRDSPDSLPYGPHPCPCPDPVQPAGDPKIARLLSGATGRGGPHSASGLLVPITTSRRSYSDSAYYTSGGSKRGQHAYPYYQQTRGSTAHWCAVPEI
ncbi:hypothetical protein JCM11251_003488 [Rhodosporidiobolus azoricus]